MDMKLFKVTRGELDHETLVVAYDLLHVVNAYGDAKKVEFIGHSVVVLNVLEELKRPQP